MGAGRGGFGKVNAVTKLEDSGPDGGTMYAMKALEKNQIVVTNMISEVLRELTFLKTLCSPHICNGHYAFQDSKHLYLVMDLSLGGDMRVHLKSNFNAQKKFTEKQAKYFLSSLIVALEYCHKNLVLHRDIKVSSCM